MIAYWQDSEGMCNFFVQGYALQIRLERKFVHHSILTAESNDSDISESPTS